MTPEQHDIALRLANQERYVTREGAVAILLADAMAVCGYPDSDSFGSGLLDSGTAAPADGSGCGRALGAEGGSHGV